MIATMALLQAALEYGAATGAPGGSGIGSAPWLDQGLHLLSENVVGVLVIAVTLVVLVGLMRTRGFRS